MKIESIADLLPVVQAVGEKARRAQEDPSSLGTRLKDDGSLLTVMDHAVEEALCSEIGRLHPDANIVSEESEQGFDPSQPFTFALDPIDGTDSFSQGMGGWCVSLGLLDQDLQPCAGIVFAPVLELCLFADIGKPALRNGQTLPAAPALPREGSGANLANLMVHSRAHRKIDLSLFKGKVRSIGSAALHLCYPAVFPLVVGAVESNRTHIWDIAGAHALAQSLGYCMEYLNGSPIDYAGPAKREAVADFVLCGHEKALDGLRTVLKRR